MGPNRENEPLGSSSPVMDIQRPAATGQTDIVRPASSLGRPATMEYTRPRTEPSSFNPANTPTPTPPSRSFVPPTSQIGDTSLPPEQPVVSPKKSKKGLVMGLILFLLLAGAAAGGAYYYFVMRETADPAPVATEPAPVEETSTIEATPEGVDKTIQSIDTNLNSVDDSADFTPNDVSDDALGL